jgi:hypothetical protein
VNSQPWHDCAPSCSADVVGFAVLGETLTPRRSQPRPHPSTHAAPGASSLTSHWCRVHFRKRVPGCGASALPGHQTSSVITLPSASSFHPVPQIWADSSCNFSSAKLNTMGPVAMPWTLFRASKPAAYRRHYATSSRVSKPSIHATHIIIFHQRLKDEDAMQICHCACNTDSDPACCLQRQMELNFPSRGMHLPVVFGSVSPIMRSVHTPCSQPGALPQCS